jgi:predicted dehydrogenase
MTPLRIGILGGARIAKAAMIEPARQTPGLVVAAVASRDIARSRDFAQTHGIARALGDYADLIADPRIDAVYNALPNSLHADWTVRALEAGKAVLCEKPFAANAVEANAMRSAAARTGAPLMEAFHYRYHPLSRHIVDLLGELRLGRLLRIEAAFEIPGALVPASDIRFQHGLAGGATMDVGAYGLNIMRLCAGEEPTVTAARPTLVGPQVDGAMEADLAFPSGAVGRLRCSLVAEHFTAQLTLTGEEGWLKVDNPFLPQMGHRLDLELEGVRTDRSFTRQPTYEFQAEAFRDLVRHGRPSLSDAADGVRNMQAIDAVYRAAGLSPRG